MGMPVNDDPLPATNGAAAEPDAQAPSTANNNTTTSDSTTGTPRSTAELPPAALDLAAKLFDLARAGDTATLSAYLRAGIPPNLTNHSGDTLLMLAAYHGRNEVVRALLERGADANTINGRGQSPLAGAVFKGHADVVHALVEGGADADVGIPNAKDTAVMFRREELFAVLGVEEGREVPGMVRQMVPGGGGTDAEGEDTGGSCPI
ncbi:ankyrin repeat-containing domain protein [Phyllosticta citricarpa]|uniref:Ankyrin repeat-containing domain protein n=2 Tax=Phyllosticta TaxID=121621 RepID=A0ABR1MF91_9PEZI